MPLLKILTLDERKRIEDLCLQEISVTKIAKILQRGDSTIKEELRKNGGRSKYNAIEAQKQADLRKQKRIDKVRKIKEKDFELVTKAYEKGQSVNSIRQEMNVSHRTIHKILLDSGLKNTFSRDIVFQKLQTLEEHIKLIYELIEAKINDPTNK